MLEEQPPCRVYSRAAELMRRSSSVIDLGTGGGERLLQLQAAWPPELSQRRNPPNFQLATRRLSPLGVRVVDVRLTDKDLMPFSNGEFELVLNRHASFNPRESPASLPGQHIFTQQVHGLWAQDLLALFDAKPQWPAATPAKVCAAVTAAGLEIFR